MKTSRLVSAVAWVAALLVAHLAQAFSITSVTLIPAEQLPPSIPLQMVVEISTPGQPAFLSAPTLVSSNEAGLHIDIFADCGPLTAIGALSETVKLGTFPVGTYRYEVILHPSYDVSWGTRTNHGSFSVKEALPVVGLDLVDREAAETRIDQNAIFWAEFRVQRSGPTTSDLVVFLNSQKGSAQQGVDYKLDGVSDAATVRIPAGTNAVNVRLYPIDDQLYEGDETALCQLIPPAPGATPYGIDPARASVEMVIHDNDSGSLVSIQAEDSKATEFPPWVDAIDPATFRISRSGDLSRELLVFFSTGGSATPGTDYQALVSPVLIPAGADSASIEVWPVYDEPADGMETVLVRLEPSPLLGPQPTYEIDPLADYAVAGIFDDLGARKPFIQIVSPREGEHFKLPTSIDIIVAAYHPEQNVLGADFFADTDKIGEWRLGQTVQNADTVVAHRFTWTHPTAGTHALTAQGLSGMNASFATSSPAKITVEGDLPRPIVSIETVSPISEESSAPLRRLPMVGVFKISRTGPATDPLPVYVTYAGTATPGVDYKPLPFVAIIPQGTNSVWLPVPPVVDDLVEGLETVVASVSNCPPPPLESPCFDFAIEPAYANASVFIRDDGITQASLMITSPAGGAIFKAGETILIKAVAIDLDGYISRVEFYDGDHLLGVSEIAFLVAPPPGTPIEHSFVWTGAAMGPHVLTARAARATGEIVLSPPVRIAVEGGANQPPAVAITQPVNGATFPPSTPIEIIVKTRDPDGYVPTVEFFADGRKIGEQTVVFIRAPDPGQTQMFSFLWREPMPGPHVLTASAIDDAGAGALSSAVEIRVAAGALPLVVVRATDALAVEPSSDGALNTANFRIRRFGATNEPLTVVYSMHGTAQNGIDYELRPGSAVIRAGSFTTDIPVRPLADNLPEGLETVRLRLEEQSLYQLGVRRRAAVLISDTMPWLAANGTLANSLPDGCFHVSFSVPTSGSLRVEASADLLTWETVLTTTAVNGALDFVEDSMTTTPWRFYRLAPETAPAASD